MTNVIHFPYLTLFNPKQPILHGVRGIGREGSFGKIGNYGKIGSFGRIGELGDGGLEIWSEGVTDGKVEGQGVLEGCHVVVAALAGVVGGMDSDAEVGAEYEHGDVETKSHTGAEGDVLEECGGFQLPAGRSGSFFSSQTLPASMNMAPWSGPTIGKRYSVLSSNLNVPVWSK